MASGLQQLIRRGTNLLVDDDPRPFSSFLLTDEDQGWGFPGPWRLILESKQEAVEGEGPSTALRPQDAGRGQGQVTLALTCCFPPCSRPVSSADADASTQTALQGHSFPPCPSPLLPLHTLPLAVSDPAPHSMRLCLSIILDTTIISERHRSAVHLLPKLPSTSRDTRPRDMDHE